MSGQNNTILERLRWYDYILILIFVIIIIVAIYMIMTFYVCDAQNCKAFNISNGYPPNSPAQAKSLLSETANDGVWPFAFIGAAITTAFAFWLVMMPFTVRDFTIVFLAAFITIYALFKFYEHHYIKPINKKVIEILDTL